MPVDHGWLLASLQLRTAVNVRLPVARLQPLYRRALVLSQPDVVAVFAL